MANGPFVERFALSNFQFQFFSSDFHLHRGVCICLQLFTLFKAISQSSFKLGQVAKPFRLQFIKRNGGTCTANYIKAPSKSMEVYCKMQGVEFVKTFLHIYKRLFLHGYILICWHCLECVLFQKCYPLFYDNNSQNPIGPQLFLPSKNLKLQP